MKRTSNRIGEYDIWSQIEFDQRDWMAPEFCDLIEACESAYVVQHGEQLVLHCDGAKFSVALGDELGLQAALREISWVFYLREKSYLKACQLSAWLRRCFNAGCIVDGSAIDE